MDIEKLKYPIGKYQIQDDYDPKQIQQWISDIENFPQQLKKIAEKITPQQLQWKYRPEGWAIKQVIHHCADSHTHSYIRFKLALTENNPTINAYDQLLWANMVDGQDDNIKYSIQLIESLHYRWVKLLKTLSNDELNKTFFHPDKNKNVSLKLNICIYAWHGKHHLAHIEHALNSMGKY